MRALGIRICEHWLLLQCLRLRMLEGSSDSGGRLRVARGVVSDGSLAEPAVKQYQTPQILNES